MLFTPVPAFGQLQFYSGNDIYSWLDVEWRNRTLNEQEWHNLALATGYVAGVADLAGSGSLICLPAQLDLGQAKDVTLKYLRSRPEIRHRSASDLVVEALQRTFPCRK